MCFMLYLGADNLIPLSLWNQDDPKVAFNNPVVKPEHFSKRNVFYVNSTECCGCGFRQETDVFYPELSQTKEKDENQKQLYEHISTFLNDEEALELFGCWAGSEDDLKSKREISVSDLLKEDFYFIENDLITIKK